MALSPKLLDILVCPACKGKVTPKADGTGLVCRHCMVSYPVRDGIPVMLADEAENVEA